MLAYIPPHSGESLAGRHLRLKPTWLTSHRRIITSAFLDPVFNRSHTNLVPVLGAGLDDGDVLEVGHGGGIVAYLLLEAGDSLDLTPPSVPSALTRDKCP